MLCIYALGKLRGNSTKLVVAMSVGIVLAVYSLYLQARMNSNPAYEPAYQTGAHWLAEHLMPARRSSLLASGCKSSSGLLSKLGCCGSSMAGMWPSRTAPQTMADKVMHFLRKAAKPTVAATSMLTGLINVVQIVLLKTYCRNKRVTAVIVGLSALGVFLSILCMSAAMLVCRGLCVACLGVHHAIIIYLAVKRLHMLDNLSCPAVAAAHAKHQQAHCAAPDRSVSHSHSTMDSSIQAAKQYFEKHTEALEPLRKVTSIGPIGNPSRKSSTSNSASNSEQLSKRRRS